MYLKLVPFSLKGVPDRLMVLPGPVIVFVELKRPRGGVVSAHQHWWRARLENLGCAWALVSTKKEARELIEGLVR